MFRVHLLFRVHLPRPTFLVGMPLDLGGHRQICGARRQPTTGPDSGETPGSQTSIR